MTDHQKMRALRRFIVTDDPHFPGMKKLKVRGRDLVYLALEVFNLTELEVLDLGPEREACMEYFLDECPPELGKLINLRVLMLDTNDLVDLPNSVTRLTKLEQVSLSNNKLKQLPQGFGNLVNISSLHLTNNSICEFPHEICNLTNLGFLDLCDNELREIPRDIDRLQNLHSLMLYNNKLTFLPDSITNLRNLRSLWLGNNQLTSLPRNFGYLVLLDWDNIGHHIVSTTLDGNPLTDPPLEVCKQGVRAIAGYFGTRAASGRGYNHEAPPPVEPHDSRPQGTYIQSNQHYHNHSTPTSLQAPGNQNGHLAASSNPRTGTRFPGSPSRSNGYTSGPGSQGSLGQTRQSGTSNRGSRPPYKHRNPSQNNYR